MAAYQEKPHLHQFLDIVQQKQDNIYSHHETRSLGYKYTENAFIGALRAQGMFLVAANVVLPRRGANSAPPNPSGQSAKLEVGERVTECLTSDIFSMLLCGVSDCIIVFSIVLAP